MLEKTVAPCVFFDSGAVTLARGKDHIHPTHEAYAVWAKAIVDQMTCAQATAQASTPPGEVTTAPAAAP